MGVARQADQAVDAAIADSVDQTLVIVGEVDPGLPTREVRDDLQAGAEDAEIGGDRHLLFQPAPLGLAQLCGVGGRVAHIEAASLLEPVVLEPEADADDVGAQVQLGRAEVAEARDVVFRGPDGDRARVADDRARLVAGAGRRGDVGRQSPSGLA